VSATTAAQLACRTKVDIRPAPGLGGLGCGHCETVLMDRSLISAPEATATIFSASCEGCRPVHTGLAPQTRTNNRCDFETVNQQN